MQVNHWEVINKGTVGIGLTAEELRVAAVRYFIWCDNNPMYKPEMLKAGEKAGEIKDLPIPRPYTIPGLCLHLGITRNYLYEISKSKVQNDYWMVANKIIEIIYTQKLEMALAGIINPIVASKELGLTNQPVADKGSPVINIIVENGPKLLENENDVDLPDDKK